MLDMTYVEIVQENAETNKQIKKARAYSEKIKAKAKKCYKEGVAFIIATLFAFLSLVAGIHIKANLDEPYVEGYYMETDTPQANGNYFVYVTERICEVTEIENDLITVEYNGNLYDFLGYGYEVGEDIVCQFTNEMEIVGVVE